MRFEARVLFHEYASCNKNFSFKTNFKHTYIIFTKNMFRNKLTYNKNNLTKLLSKMHKKKGIFDKNIKN